MIKNLRIVNATVNDSSNIDVNFTDNLVPNLVVANVSIISDSPNTPNSTVLSIKIAGSIMSIVCQPLTPFASYFIQFQSTPTNPFISIHGDAKLSENGVANKILITGPLAPDNPVQDFLTSFLRDNIYSIDDDQSIVSQYIKSLSVTMAQALYDIRQVKNENYLSVTIVDEKKTRGAGPYDRLNEEGAYEVVRVGKTLTGTSANAIFSFDDFPYYPITLQRQTNTETLQAGSLDEVGNFNINSLILNLNSSPITKVNSIVFTFITSNPVYTYDISILGYQIQNARYDQDFAFAYAQLADNQVKISDQVLQDPNFVLNSILKVDVIYETKNLGIVVDPSSVNMNTILTSIREVLPPIINVFNLKFAPIVNSDNSSPTISAITFTDPNILGATHPAFINELPFRLNGLPFLPGQYSVDYSTGTVYVYGADITNDGTGPYPPLATYQYRLTYKADQDYTYDPDAYDLIAIPTGNLLANQGNVNFSYEEVLVPNLDYIANTHQEALNERILNNLVALNVLKTANSPITNIFQIFNETSGEIYTLDRWNDNRVYFRYNTPPEIDTLVAERASFNDVINELLFVDTTLTNISSLRVFKILLNNNGVVASTEDALGAFFNSSLILSSTNIFTTEKWFNREDTEANNINRLLNVGEYIVDYANGVIYCAVSNTQQFDIGTATYKDSFIVPQNPHLISVDDIYYRISTLNPKNKQFSYISFDDGIIEPSILDASDELFLNNNNTAPYQINNTSVGIFLASTFISGVTNQVKFVRSVYEYNDLLNSPAPFNFVRSATSAGFNINVASFSNQVFDTVSQDTDGYYVNINENVPYFSSGITYTFSVVRASDGYVLWDTVSGVAKAGHPIKLILAKHSPNVGDLVTINYTFTINNLSRVVVDYNRGDYFIDYTYLADEILISYEYGDNVLDFRQGGNLPANSTYYATYKVGALRDALLRNFGSLINVAGLNDVELDFERERYRDALTAGLTSFIQGPTLAAIKNIVKTISHIEPEIVESAFQSWSLGNSLLTSESISTIGEFQLLPAKFNNGALINDPSQSITFPVNSNLRLEEGTFETWISPQWNGLDNYANLTFSIMQDGYVIDNSKIFIGAGEIHPTISNGVFSLNKNDNVAGKPNTNKDGIFIYYDNDISGNFQRWYLEIIDGYVSPTSSAYKLKISSDGSFYDAKSLTSSTPSNMTIFTGVNAINLSITSGSAGIDEGLTFLSDFDHYILDFGEEKAKNRLSIYKDVSGYINFRVYDRNKTSYSISADVSSWSNNEFHNVSASWKLNNRDGRDEMHLFLDGFEVPNIIRYGQRLQPYLHEKFRTVDPEEIIGSINRDILASTDLQTTIGSDGVFSSINFGVYNIFNGDTIFIDEPGFSTTGYTIIAISGQTLTLNAPMPATLTNGRFSINRTNFKVLSDINVAPNIAVATIHASVSGTDLSGTDGYNVVSSASTNFTTAGILPGYLLRIDGYSILPTTFTILQVSGHNLTINDNLSINLSNGVFRVYSNTENEIPGVRALLPAYSISQDGYFNNILTISNDVEAGDLILIRTLGLNHRKVKQDYYVWSDDLENILMTRLPPPISLDEARITKIILPTTSIGSNNSTLISGTYHSNNLTVSQPSNAQNGRTIEITLSGNNVDFSSPVQVNINGVVGVSTITETISFTDYGSLDTANLFISINYINVVVKPINPAKGAVTIIAKEKHSITHSENSGLVPVVKYSYQIGAGYNLYGDGYFINSDGYTVTDDGNLFSGLDIGNYLVISSPSNVAGFYIITGLSPDRHSLYIEATSTSFPMPMASFTNGIYQILNVNAYRSGLQNGFFTFEISNMPSQAYFLSSGFYELKYFTYTKIKIDPISRYAYIGSDFENHHHIDAIIDQVKIYSVLLTDTRIGESIPANQTSITKDFNSLKALHSDPTTLMLIDFDTFPFTNSASIYTSNNTIKDHFPSSIVVNENFGNSLTFLDKPIIVPNAGILDVKKQGTIEFWISPLFDTGNDPNVRYYFDAFGAVVEEAVSVNNVSVKISAPASKILSVKLKGGDPSIDYFAGGKLEIDTQRAVQETATSLSDSSVLVSQPVLQVITVKIVGDLTETDYFNNGTIGSDKKTIYLGTLLPSNSLQLIITYQTTNNNNQQFNTQVIRLNKKLPYQKTHVIVNYIPNGLQGDRISIFKDEVGYINFSIIGSNSEYVIRAPTFWAKNTWHRVKASYILNSGVSKDQMRLFLDGYQFNNVLFGDNLVFNTFPFVMGSVSAGDGYGFTTNISFKDPINDLFIGSQYSGDLPIFSLLDNFRISNISRPIYAPYGEPLDVNYSSNLSMAFPVTPDLYTTYLLDFNSTNSLNQDFAILINRETGLFDFSINVFDTFDIISSNVKSQEALENLVKVLKPANSRVFIKYT